MPFWDGTQEFSFSSLTSFLVAWREHMGLLFCEEVKSKKDDPCCLFKAGCETSEGWHRLPRPSARAGSSGSHMYNSLFSLQQRVCNSSLLYRLFNGSNLMFQAKFIHAVTQRETQRPCRDHSPACLWRQRDRSSSYSHFEWCLLSFWAAKMSSVICLRYIKPDFRS